MRIKCFTYRQTDRQTSVQVDRRKITIEHKTHKQGHKETHASLKPEKNKQTKDDSTKITTNRQDRQKQTGDGENLLQEYNKKHKQTEWK